MKKYLLVLLLRVFIIPSILFASWWNPLSWFNKSDSTIKQVQPKQSVNTQTPQENVIEKPTIQEKTVVKTITVDNPELQKKIDELSQKLTDESDQLIQATTQYNNLLDKYNKTIQGDNAFATAMQSIVTNMAQECKRQPIYMPYVSPVSSFTPFTCTSDNIAGSTY